MKGPSLPPPRLATLNAVLAEAARGGSGLTFVDLREKELELSWAEIHQSAARVAGALAQLGIRPSDRVAVVQPTGPSFVEAFFGILLAGAVPVPLYPPVRLGRLPEYHAATARMLQGVEARLVLTDSRVRRLLGQAVAKARPALGCRTMQALLESHAPALEVAGDPDELALVQFSSGSTVDPKPVALTHRNLLAQCATLRALFPSSEGGPQLGVSWLPLYHDMGLIGALLSAAYYPGPLALIAPQDFLARPALWLRAISRHRGTLSGGPNFAYALCLKRIRDEELDGVDLSSWRVAFDGAEPISAEVVRRFGERFARWGFRAETMVPVYGLAEASLVVTASPQGRAPRVRRVDPAALAERGEVRPGARELVSVGKPVPGVELELRGDDGGALLEGRLGRIHLRGPSVMRGYFGNEPATREVLRKGWLDTGDLGFVAEGELYVCGRAKEVIIIRGANHPPQEFEECLDGLLGLRAGCAVAVGFVPPGGEGEELLILAERSGEEDPGLEERIRSAVLSRTAIRASCIRVLAPGTLPRTSSGKLRRAEALRRHLAGQLEPPLKVHALRLATEMLRSAAAFVRIERLDEC